MYRKNTLQTHLFGSLAQVLTEIVDALEKIVETLSLIIKRILTFQVAEDISGRFRRG